MAKCGEIYGNEKAFLDRQNYDFPSFAIELFAPIIPDWEMRWLFCNVKKDERVGEFHMIKKFSPRPPSAHKSRWITCNFDIASSALNQAKLSSSPNRISSTIENGMTLHRDQLFSLPSLRLSKVEHCSSRFDNQDRRFIMRFERWWRRGDVEYHEKFMKSIALRFHFLNFSWHFSSWQSCFGGRKRALEMKYEEWERVKWRKNIEDASSYLERVLLLNFGAYDCSRNFLSEM